MKYFKYLDYIIRHKWYVFVECCKIGRPIVGIIHDWTKFLPSEFFPYVNYFYTEYNNTTFYEAGQNAAFDRAWLRHIHRNPHHWQYWILSEDKGDVKLLPMTPRYREELLCDWKGAGKAQRNPDSVAQWYWKNKSKMKFHPETEKWIEENI